MYTDNVTFTKENLDGCLSRLAKEFRRQNGKQVSAEIILIGGAAVLTNYGFRNMTYDVDAIIRANASMKEAINKIGDELGLPNNWLNSDFIRTKSYSPRLVQYSKYYKKFGGILEVRTVSGEYLVAMKLMSGRQYKNDISDVVGILYEEKKRNNPLSFEKIKMAVENLYGNYDVLPQESKQLIEELMTENQIENLYEIYRNRELSTKEALIDFEKRYPKETNTDNVNEIIAQLRQRKSQEDL